MIYGMHRLIKTERRLWNMIEELNGKYIKLSDELHNPKTTKRRKDEIQIYITALNDRLDILEERHYNLAFQIKLKEAEAILK